MTQDEIIRMALQAGVWEEEFPAALEWVVPFANLVAEATKEKAAKVCEVIAGQNPDTALTCAAAIRSMK